MKTSGKYILKGHLPVEEHDLMKWARWFETAKRRVAFTQIKKVDISTVFLGMDYNFIGEGEPVLFETMIFGGKYNEYQQRYSTWEEAENGHKEAVNLVKNHET